MSDLFGRVSTADTGERQDFDYYPTPSFMVRSLLHFHPAIKGCDIFEPCAGDGAISRVLRAEFGCYVMENDLDPRHQCGHVADATDPRMWDAWDDGYPPAQWVITNPPFNIALPIIQNAVKHARIGVAFLLRKTFLEPTDDRGPWLMEHPPTRCIGEPRYSFRGKGSDSVSCDWMLWERYPDRTLTPFEIDYVAERRVR